MMGYFQVPLRTSPFVWLMHQPMTFGTQLTATERTPLHLVSSLWMTNTDNSIPKGHVQDTHQSPRHRPWGRTDILQAPMPLRHRFVVPNPSHNPQLITWPNRIRSWAIRLLNLELTGNFDFPLLYISCFLNNSSCKKSKSSLKYRKKGLGFLLQSFQFAVVYPKYNLSVSKVRLIEDRLTTRFIVSQRFQNLFDSAQGN